MNVAMSVDGKLDSVARKGMTISSTADKARVDRLRSSMDAVLVGGRTLLDEDPNSPSNPWHCVLNVWPLVWKRTLSRWESLAWRTCNRRAIS